MWNHPPPLPSVTEDCLNTGMTPVMTDSLPLVEEEGTSTDIKWGDADSFLRNTADTLHTTTLLNKEVLKCIRGFEDEILPDIPEEFLTCLPPPSDFSLPWTSEGCCEIPYSSRTSYVYVYSSHIFANLRGSVFEGVVALLKELKGHQPNHDTTNVSQKAVGDMSKPARSLKAAQKDNASEETNDYMDFEYSSVKNNAIQYCLDSICSTDSRDPSALRFTIKKPKMSFDEKNAVSDLSSFKGPITNIREGSIVMVFLPLNDVLNGMKQEAASALEEGEAQNTAPSISSMPSLWRQIDCVPHICMVDGKDTNGSLILQTCEYPFQSSAYNTTGAPLMPYTPFFRFSQALTFTFTAKNSLLYVHPLPDMHSNAFIINCLKQVMRPGTTSKFSSLLLAPRAISPIAAQVQEALKQYLDKPCILPYMRSLLYQGKSLNDSQLKAVTSCLYFIQPDWEVLQRQQLSEMDNKLPLPDSEYHPPARHEESPILIVEGPPGTGKTKTIATLLKNLLMHIPKARRILVCAASNAAVDEVLLRVLSLCDSDASKPSSPVLSSGEFSSKWYNNCPNGQLVRLGVRHKVNAEVLENSLPLVFIDDLVERKLNMKFGMDDDTSDSEEPTAKTYMTVTSKKNMKNWYRIIKREILDDARVIFSTLGSLHKLSDSEFDVVIIDEASQATEPDVVQALALSKGKCILVGDSKQLKPTVLCLESAKKGMDRSLLVRLLNCGFPSTLLRTQYRMHPDICRFPNNYVYNGALSTGDSVLERTKKEKSIGCKLGNMKRFHFCNVFHGIMSFKENSSCNCSEAKELVSYMRQLRWKLHLSVEDFGKHCGIITFYRAQCNLIRKLLNPQECKAITVATVDSYQGKEMDIILISCVRAPKHQSRTPNESVSLGFLSDVGRLNVALTRAKELCVVFGHEKTLSSPSKDGDMLRQMIISGENPNLRDEDD